MSRSTSLPLSQLAWYHSIALNNEGLDHLKDGRIREGHDVLLLASKIHQQASFDSNFDDCGAYCNNWMNIASGVNSIQTSSSNKEEMHYVFPYGLRIQTGSSQLIATDDDNGDQLFRHSFFGVTPLHFLLNRELNENLQKVYLRKKFQCVQKAHLLMGSNYIVIEYWRLNYPVQFRHSHL